MNKVLDISAEEAPPLQESRPEAVGLAIESGRATIANKESKRDIDNKQEINLSCPTQQHQTRENKPIKYKMARCSSN